MKTPLNCLSFFQICPTPQPPPLPTFFAVLFLWLTVWSRQMECVILLNDIMFSLGTLVLTAPCCVFYATRNQIYWRFDTDDMVFASALIWHQTHRQKQIRHTGTNRLTHTYIKYILTSPVTCTHQLPVHWVNNLLIQKLALQKSICWLYSKRLSPSLKHTEYL